MTTPGPSWAAWASSRNAKARHKGRWRQPMAFDADGPRGTLGPGQGVVSFASNDYLGLSAHPQVTAAAKAAIDRWGTGAGASRLVSGTRPVHSELEAHLADWRSCEAAMLFPTGFAANLGTLSALGAPGTLIFTDASNHASIIDGCRQASALGARVHTYPHLDLTALARLLTAQKGRAIVVTDSVFSMDGDAAPITDLAELCAAHHALLVVDEAHAVLGPHFGRLPCEVLRVGTLSKALGSLGGFVAGDREMIEMLVNRSRPYIYTTALAPACAAAADAALRVLRSGEGEQLLARLNGYCQLLQPGRPPVSPIFPVVLGSEEAAVAASVSLLAEGIWVPAIRPPTVPPGTSRLRVTLSAAHRPGEVGALITALDRLGLHPAPGAGHRA